MSFSERITHKIGPLPAWGWAVLIGGGGYLYLRHRQATAATAAAPAATDTSSVAPIPAGDASTGSGGGSGGGSSGPTAAEIGQAVADSLGPSMGYAGPSAADIGQAVAAATPSQNSATTAPPPDHVTPTPAQGRAPHKTGIVWIGAAKPNLPELQRRWPGSHLTVTRSGPKTGEKFVVTAR